MSDNELMDAMEELEGTGLSPADCKYGCKVEIDGRCPHGQRSVLGDLV